MCDWDFRCADHGLQMPTDQPAKHAQYDPSPTTKSHTTCWREQRSEQGNHQKNARWNLGSQANGRDQTQGNRLQIQKTCQTVPNPHRQGTEKCETQEISSKRGSRRGCSDGDLDVTWQTDFQLNPSVAAGRPVAHAGMRPTPEHVEST